MRQLVSGRVGAKVAAGFLLLVSTMAHAEQVELVTYYPAPAVATDTPPPKPYRFYFSQPVAWTFKGDGQQHLLVSSQTSVDIYRDLQLWRYGVTRDQMRMTGWGGCVGAARVGCSQEEGRFIGGRNLIVTFSAPYFGQGVVSALAFYWNPSENSNHTESPQIYEIIVDWEPFA